MKASSLKFHRAALRLGCRRKLPRAFVMAIVACSMGLNPVFAGEPLADRHDFLNAEALPGSEGRTIELEALFWMCDHAASVADLDSGQAAQCEAVTEQLKRIKFAGDSERMLGWWRLNRADAHREMASGSGTLDCRNVAQSEAGSHP